MPLHPFNLRMLAEELTEMHEEFSAVREEATLGDETRRYMRVLHEEVISRLATIHGQDA